MYKKRNAQGLSITTIIVAVIGLIIVIVLIAIFTGRIGGFSRSLDTAETEVKTCSSLCGVQGLVKHSGDVTGTEECRVASPSTYKVLSGTFTDVTSGVCCCI